jgi:hypothetical protein
MRELIVGSVGILKRLLLKSTKMSRILRRYADSIAGGAEQPQATERLSDECNALSDVGPGQADTEVDPPGETVWRLG